VAAMLTQPLGVFDAALLTIAGRPLGHPVEVFVDAVMSAQPVALRYDGG
jgi:hypothetical protein